MSVVAFKPKRPDGKSYRDIVVELIKDQPPDRVITYERIADACGVSVKNDMAVICGTVRQANKVLNKVHHRAVANVRGVGYRVIKANEHMVVANDRQSKARRQMDAALLFMNGANTAEMTPTERTLHQGQHMMMSAVRMGFAHLDRRLKKVEDLLAGTNTINQ